MKIANYIFYIFFACTMFIACSSNEDILQIEPTPEKEEEVLEGAYAKQIDFVAGDEFSRSSYIYNNNLMHFSWGTKDPLGIFATSPENGVYDDNTIRQIQQSLFIVSAPGANYSHLDYSSSESSEYGWVEGYKRTAYFKYNKNYSPQADPEITFRNIPFSFEGQIQKAIPDMNAFYKGTAGSTDEITVKGSTNSTYVRSETAACAHLGDKDFLISPEATYSSGHIRFFMHHIGAVARLYLLAPKEPLRIKRLRLVATKPIFYTRGTADLSSQPYTPTASDGNDGLKLAAKDCPVENRQIHPDESSKTHALELAFEGVTTKYDKTASPYGNYLIAYLMMYPVNTAGCEMYVYLEAEQLDASGNVITDASGNPVTKTYRTDNINNPARDLYSGKYYLWTYKTLDDEHPIELTATVIPWQDIAGGNINLGDDDE